MTAKPEPTLVAFVSDLMFTTRIEDAARRLGYHVEWVEAAPVAGEAGAGSPPGQLAEHTSGPGASLLYRLATLQPVLLIFDLGNAAIPWREWLPLVKSAPATRRIPAICFGSHVDTQTFQYAQSCGADAVLARSRFFQDLPALIQKYARLPDYQAIESACQAPLSALARRGLELFNHGEYFEAHEVLEAAWNEDHTPGRELYRAILQAAVAYLQIERGNYPGAAKMLLRLKQWIDPLPEVCRGVQVEKLRQDVRQVEEQLLALGQERIAQFDRSLFKPVIYISTEESD